jgi:anti-sigma regulatory factor (Ser/Thr protein kinase)
MTFDDYETRLEIGSGLVLFTDGVVEVERNYFQGIADLHVAAMAEYYAPSANIAEGMLQRVLGGRKPKDDAALLFVGLTGLGLAASDAKEQRWRFEAANEDAARRVKRAVLWELAGFASASPEFGETEVILGELLGNVVRHSPGEATVFLERREGRMVLHVEDEGNPFSLNGRAAPDPFAESGRGLSIVQAVAQAVEVTRTASGNRVSAVLPIEAR